MNDSHHAIVWIDHSEATVSLFRGNEQSDVDIHSHTSLQRLHHRQSGWEAGSLAPEDTEFFHRIVGALDPDGGVVITGPGYAKLAFKSFLDQHRPGVAARVIAVETSDRPADDGLRALGRRYFVETAANRPTVADAAPEHAR